MSYPDDNPKTAIGATKAPLHLVPPSAIHYLALAFKDGAVKYGPYNWRDQKVSSSVYVGAAMRHIGAWWDGENVSSDAGVEHLAHVMACCAIILDAASVGMLNDDRPTNGAAPRLQAEFANRKVSHQPDADEAAEDAELDIDWSACFPTRAQLDDGTPAESAYLASFAPNADIPEKSPLAGSRIATPAEVAYLLRAYEPWRVADLRKYGIGDVAETATTVAISQHPMAAEVLRDEYERGDGATGV